jgi:hypothetical protein
MADETGWTIHRSTSTINGVVREAVRVEIDGHVIEAVELDMADQWDFMEMAGPQIDNDAWVNTALLASAVISIDGLPQPAAAKTRDGIRQILRKIGARGVDALHAAFSEERSESGGPRERREASAVGN